MFMTHSYLHLLIILSLLVYPCIIKLRSGIDRTMVTGKPTILSTTVVFLKSFDIIIRFLFQHMNGTKPINSDGYFIGSGKTINRVTQTITIVQIRSSPSRSYSHWIVFEYLILIHNIFTHTTQVCPLCLESIA